MARKNKIFSSYRSRLMLTFTTILVLILSTATVSTYVMMRKNISERMFSNLQHELLLSTYDIKNIIDNNSELVLNLSTILSSYNEIIKDNRRTFFENILYKTIEDNYDIYSVWTVFKPYTIDDLDEFYGKPYEAITGQFAVNYKRETGRINTKKSGPDDYTLLDNYIPKFQRNQQVIILGPLEDPYWQLAGKSYIIRMVAPVVNEKQIVGLVGIDINLKTLSEIIHKANFGIYILDDNLYTIYSNDPNSAIGKNITETYPYLNNNYQFLKNIASYKNFKQFAPLFEPDESVYFSSYPVYFSNAMKYWSVIFFQSKQQTLSAGKKEAFTFIIVPIIVFALIFITLLLIVNNLSRFFSETVRYTKILARAEQIKSFRYVRENTEMKNIQNSLLNISSLLEQTKNLTYSILNDKKIDENEESFNDEISKNLIKINKKFNEERAVREQQVKIQEQVNIVSNALAQINAIQRNYSEDIEMLAYETIKFITDFTDSVQGGFYITEENESGNSYLNLIAFYSYNRRIYNKKTIEFGDGLAGTCALEMKPVYSKVPLNYLEITSGLGKIPPNFIYLMPLINQDKNYGIIEIAFLEELKDHHKQFLNSVSEIIASTIATAENNARTKRLLEQTQKITDQMRAKELEMNDQIKELESLKSRSELIELDRTAMLKTIDKLTFFAEFDRNANVLSINNNLSEKLQIQYVDALMMTYYDILFVIDYEQHNDYWAEVLKGKTVEYDHNISLGKFNFWFRSILTPVYNTNNEIYKVIYFATDYTEIKKREEEVKKLLIDINEKAEQISVQEQEFDDFLIEYQNAMEEMENMKKKVNELTEEKNNFDKSMDFIQKEFQKRSNRAKRVEMNLKSRIKTLEDELEALKSKE